MEITSKNHLAASITSRLAACSHDELRVLAEVLAGIEQGRGSYGPLDLARDQRDFAAEGAAELRDFLFYASAASVAAQAHRRERMECDVADRVSSAMAPLKDFDLGGES